MNYKKETLLIDLDVLVVDCQATSSAPGKGNLLEIGWAGTKASGEAKTEKGITSYLIKLPVDTEIPRQVKRITGIGEEDLENALSPKKAWKKLHRAAKKTAAAGQNKLCPTVIHFSRFEEPYLRQLQEAYSPRGPFPFDIICTHQIVKTLLPQLPRKGLRAAAGYFGHSAPELRRCASHIEATQFTWKKTVSLLAESEDIRMLSELREWLKKAKRAGAINSKSKTRHYPMKAEERKGLPDRPGVYHMLRSNGDLLYIGKAKSLKQRVGSYFQKSAKHAERTLEMLTQAQKLEITQTGSALEAAILESDRIKHHAPPYNVALRQGNREIVFFSKDLSKCSPTPGEEHPLGPLPSKESLAAFAATAAFISGRFPYPMDEDSPALILNMPEEYAPGLDCFLQGVELFNQRHRPALEGYGDDNILNGLMRLGKELRREKLAELALAEAAAAEENDEEDETPGSEASEEEERVWTPEAVVSVMAGIIRHGAHLVRRARWFCLLSESTLSWQEIIGKEERHIRIRFEEGKISDRGDAKTGKESDLPLPPGSRKRFRERRRSFDLSTYDRMRVVTTELRRMIMERVAPAAHDVTKGYSSQKKSSQENKILAHSNKESHSDHVRLYLGPAAILDKKQLTELLKWV